MRKGSALLMVLWIILVLGIIVISFSFEAKLQGGVNVYVQGKNRVKRLMDAGRVIGETVILGYRDALDWAEDEDPKELDEDDRWYLEKRNLKNDSKCTIGPIVLDEQDPDSGILEIELSMRDVETGGGININKLCQSGDDSYIIRWQMILDMMGVPREDDFRAQEGKSINLQYRVIACWNDFVDEDDTVTTIEGVAMGAEKSDYLEYYDEHKDDFADEDRFEPSNGEIVDIKELSRVLCFREYPAILTGGVLNPWEDKENQITITTGLINLGIFGTIGGTRVDANDCSVEELMTVPGVYVEDEVDEDDKSESREIAEAIVACRSIKPEGYDVDETREWWPYKDWNDLKKRISDEFAIKEIGEEASSYIIYRPEESTVFSMKIVSSLMDMRYQAEAECYIKDNKVRYISWKEY